MSRCRWARVSASAMRARKPLRRTPTRSSSAAGSSRKSRAVRQRKLPSAPRRGSRRYERRWIRSPGRQHSGPQRDGETKMSWLQKLLPPRIKATPGIAKKAMPEGLWVKCPACEAVLYRTDLEKNLNVCPKCSHHGRVSARERIEELLDPDGRYEIGSEVLPIDSLKFKDTRKYPERLSAALEETGETDALVVMQGSIRSAPLVIAVFEFDFMRGSMGSVVGERFVRGVRVAYENRIPYVCITSSGGARMQEGVSSLFQMAKTTAVLQELTKARLPFVSILTDPTMGGVSASFAMIGDLGLAEAGALIGFAGPRVIEKTVREKLPEGFQRAEFLLEKGAIDMIVDRRQLKDDLPKLLTLLQSQPLPTG